MNARFILSRALVLTSILLSTARADVPPPRDAVLLDRAMVRQAFAMGGTLAKNDAFKVLAGRRVVPGVAEIHAHDTDIFYVTAGSAIFVTGGNVRDITGDERGETRGKSIDGGAEHHLHAGDVIIIPAGVPHWFKSVEGDFRYFVVKVTR